MLFLRGAGECLVPGVSAGEGVGLACSEQHSAEEICSCLAVSFITRSFLQVTFAFAEGLLRFLLSPLIRAAYLGTLTHLHSAVGGDV